MGIISEFVTWTHFLVTYFPLKKGILQIKAALEITVLIVKVIWMHKLLENLAKFSTVPFLENSQYKMQSQMPAVLSFILEHSMHA